MEPEVYQAPAKPVKRSRTSKYREPCKKCGDDQYTEKAGAEGALQRWRCRACKHSFRAKMVAVTFTTAEQAAKQLIDKAQQKVDETDKIETLLDDLIAHAIKVTHATTNTPMPNPLPRPDLPPAPSRIPHPLSVTPVQLPPLPKPLPTALPPRYASPDQLMPNTAKPARMT